MLEIYKEPLISMKRFPTYVLLALTLSIITYIIVKYQNEVGSVFNLTGSTKGDILETGASTQSIFADKLEPFRSPAVKLVIPSQNIDINLISVGIENDGSLEAPKDWRVGGWYENGPMPGEKGNMIINAHYDDIYARPAAFWSLKNVNVNDTVHVVDEIGNEYVYQVTEIVYIDITDPNRLEVLETEGDFPSITLITCGGVWVPGASTYSKRLIVKGSLID